MYKYASEPLLPWSDTDSDQQFNKITLKVLAVFFVLFIVFPLLPKSEVKKDKFDEVPPRFARLLIKQPIKPIIKKPEPKKIEKKKKKEIKKKPKKKIKKKITKKKANKPKPKPKPSAKKVAQSVFDSAGFDELADIRDDFNVAALKNSKLKTVSKRKEIAFDASRVLTSKASSGSGGIKSEIVSIRDNTKLKQRDTTNVQSNIKTTGNKRRNSRSVGRSDEEVQLTFQRYKGKLFSIYNRALRTDPGLQGTILFKITINAAGTVINIKVISSEINNNKLVKRMRLRIKRFKFGAKPGASNFTFTYPLDLIPQ